MALVWMDVLLGALFALTMACKNPTVFYCLNYFLEEFVRKTFFKGVLQEGGGLVMSGLLGLGCCCWLMGSRGG